MIDRSGDLLGNAGRSELKLAGTNAETRMEYSGSEYEGTYEAGRFSGNGTYTYPDGESRPHAL